MRLPFWPRSLAARTALVLLLGLAVVQGAGLTIHAFDRLDVQRLSQARDLAVRVVGLYRTMALTDPARRAAVLAELHRGSDLSATLSDVPPQVDMPEMPMPDQRLLRVNMNLVPLGPSQLHWQQTSDLRRHTCGVRSVIGLRLPNNGWLNVTAGAGAAAAVAFAYFSGGVRRRCRSPPPCCHYGPSAA